jgi:hypothetical protein
LTWRLDKEGSRKSTCDAMVHREEPVWERDTKGTKKSPKFNRNKKLNEGGGGSRERSRKAKTNHLRSAATAAWAGLWPHPGMHGR